MFDYLRSAFKTFAPHRSTSLRNTPFNNATQGPRTDERALLTRDEILVGQQRNDRAADDGIDRASLRRRSESDLTLFRGRLLQSPDVNAYPLFEAEQRLVAEVGRIVRAALPKDLARVPSRATRWYDSQKIASLALKENPILAESGRDMLDAYLQAIELARPKTCGHPGVLLSHNGILQDCRSTRRTRVNGVIIVKPIKLREGAIVEIECKGSSTFHLFRGGRLHVTNADNAKNVLAISLPRKSLKITYPVGFEQSLAQARLQPESGSSSLAGVRLSTKR